LKPETDKTNDIQPKRNQKYAAELEIPIESLYEIFDKEEEDQLTVINFVGRTNKQKVQNIALLIILGYKWFFGQEEVPSQEIRRNISENKIPLNNVSLHLRELTPKFLRRIEDSRVARNSYRLTRIGVNKSKELIKEIIGKSSTKENTNEEFTFPIEILLDNTNLWAACKTAFNNEEYWNACLHALIYLETKIREKSELTANDTGVDLVSKAFKLNGGVLKIPSCAVQGEEEGFLLINLGVVKFHRNAKGHRTGSIGRKNAAKIICYVDYLLEILKTAEKR
jgi:uncharacterized protein (TIGR02391 family)